MASPTFPTNPAQSTAAQIHDALRLANAGHIPEAASLLRDVLALEPANASASCLLAALLQQLGEHAAALELLDRATALSPHDATIHETRAGLLLTLGQTAEAERAASAALAIDPNRPRALLHLGSALDMQGRAGETAAALQLALRLQPDSASARRLLARALMREHDADGALASVLHPSLLGDEARAREVVDEFCLNSAQPQAIVLLEALVERHPDSYSWIVLMARALHQAGRSSSALAWSERAHQLRPFELEPLEMRAVSLIDRGEVTSGLEVYRSLLARGGATAETASRHLILAHYDPALDNDALFALHTQWVKDHVEPFGAPFHAGGTHDPQRRLRVAWLSPRFTGGPVASFLGGLLAAFDREHFEHSLVALQRSAQHARQSLRGLADRWLDLHDLSDADLLLRLRECSFDIVIDLAGHSTGNRIRVLAQRVAPIQLCWLDYFDTTAVAAMDGWISDPWLTPEGSPQRFSEPVRRLPSGRFCYTPPPDAPDPGRIGAGPPVFASFNRMAKLNDEVVDVWAAILQRVPEAQLELGAGLLGDAAARARTLERFAARGIENERLRLKPERSYAELLAAYRAIDIALDPFPFSGCTTTCDALWMGVPVIARDGTAFVARQSASLLARLGRDAWIAGSSADYVERAVALAGRIDGIRLGRHDLREQTRRRLCDARAQARDFAALLQSLWQDHCAGAAQPGS
jgi:predicted O-linked N-acetylglucosamine transferase (SPINDLY family)